MKPRLKSTRAARDLIKTHEPFLGEAQRRGRRWLVGYGHSAAAKEGVSLTRENAELLLIYDVLLAEQAVETAAGDDLPAPMRDALVSFAASVGANAFKVSDVARLTRAGKHREAAAALETWVRAEEAGRLVVSERLVRRRAAEKALFLTALEAPAEAAAPEAVPEPAAQTPPEPAPRLGPLVEVDIAFEDWSEPAAGAQGAAAGEEPAAEPAPYAEASAQPGPDAVAETDAEPAPEPESEPESEPEPELQPASQAARTEQDGAVQAVLARMAASMAGDAARSVAPVESGQDPEPAGEPEPATDTVPEPEPEPEPENAAALHASDTPVSDSPVLGYSFLTPAIITAPMPQSAPAPEPVHQPAPEPALMETQASAPDLRADPVPPHPGEAPARAAGLSGEVDGPERPEGELSETVHEDDSALDPAHVAGREAMVHPGDEATPDQPQSAGINLFIANLGIGLLMTGLGASLLVANFETYMAEGIGNDWAAPGLIAAGVLMAVASGITLVGRLKERRTKRA
ncbi:glycoside hydrolase family protein [Hyphomonadaceae bacterium BL14]|nr:glycoside hydrolase family protein [Hyphomonadaceae bacterium BL14]